MKRFTGEPIAADAAEQALRDSEERFRLATQAGKIGIWDWNIVTDQVLWSESLYDIHGLQPDELAPNVEGFLKLVHPADREMVQERIARALENDAPFEFEFRALRPDGSMIWLATSARLLHRGGKPVTEGFSYSSDSNPEKLDARGLQTLLAMSYA